MGLECGGRASICFDGVIFRLFSLCKDFQLLHCHASSSHQAHLYHVLRVAERASTYRVGLSMDGTGGP